jgi:hypothetical protein
MVFIVDCASVSLLSAFRFVPFYFRKFSSEYLL